MNLVAAGKLRRVSFCFDAISSLDLATIRAVPGWDSTPATSVGHVK